MECFNNSVLLLSLSYFFIWSTQYNWEKFVWFHLLKIHLLIFEMQFSQNSSRNVSNQCRASPCTRKRRRTPFLNSWSCPGGSPWGWRWQGLGRRWTGTGRSTSGAGRSDFWTAPAHTCKYNKIQPICMYQKRVIQQKLQYGRYGRYAGLESIFCCSIYILRCGGEGDAGVGLYFVCATVEPDSSVYFISQSK